MTPHYENFNKPFNSFLLEVEGGILKRYLVSVTLMIKQYYRNAVTRQQLKKLAPWQLDDIGISVEQAAMESKKRFWEK